MKRKAILQFILGVILLVLFVLFTWSLTFFDLQPIGPEGSSVAYASINQSLHKLFEVNMNLYNITNWAVVVAILIALGFVILGLVQWIKRKHILKVDSSILFLGVFYILFDKRNFGSILSVFCYHACHVCSANRHDAVPPFDWK